MHLTDDQIIQLIIRTFEGGDRETNIPGDLGGRTRFGISEFALRDYLGREPVPSDYENLTLEIAVEIGRELFLRRPGISGIMDWRVRLAVADYAFNAGTDDAVPALQRAVGVKADGRIGPLTLKAVAEHPALETAMLVVADRLAFHVKRSRRSKQRQFLDGWVNRCSRLLSIIALGGAA